MILDASTLRPGRRGRPDPGRRRRPRSAGRAQDRALRLGLRDDHARLRRRRRGRRGAAGAPARRRGRGGPRGSRDRGGRHPSVRARRGSADRRRGALHRLQALRRDQRPPPGRAGPARPRRHGVGRRVLALPRGDPALASGRARAVGELAVARRRADGDGLEPRARPRRAAARGRPAGVRLVRGVGGVGRAARALGVAAGLHADLVGRPAASAVRHARGARSRPADRRRRSRPRSPRSCRRSAPRRSTAACRATDCCSPTEAGATTRRTAGRLRASARAPSCSIPTGTSVAAPASSDASCSSSCARGSRSRRRVAARADRPRPRAKPTSARGGDARRLRRRISSPAR